MVALKARVIAAFFVVVFSDFFLTGIFEISPVYFAFITAFFLEVATKCLSLKAHNRSEYLAIIMLSVYLFLSAIIFVRDLKQTLLSVFSLLSYVVASEILLGLRLSEIKKIIRFRYFFASGLLLVDFVYRIMHPIQLEWEYSGYEFVYMFKTSSIIFHDTNEVGFLVLVLLALELYINTTDARWTWRGYSVLLFVLLAGTFSRAAILGYFAVLFWEKVYKHLTRVKKITVLFLFFFLLLIVLKYLVTDASFFSKLSIFRRLAEYMVSVSPIDFLLGHGYGSSTAVLGLYGHAHIVILFVEFGIIGLVLFIVVLSCIYSKNKDTIYLLLPFFVTGFSYMPMVIPFFYVSLALINALSRAKSLC